MKNTLKVNHIERTIVMDRTFAKFAENTRSEEYAHLQEVRKDYPTYQVVRRTIKKSSNKETYAGLTYDYMKDYILRYSKTMEERLASMAELEDLLFIAECHSKGKRYPTIKAWFLEKYPEVKKFGIVKTDDEKEEAEATNNIEALPSAENGIAA